MAFSTKSYDTGVTLKYRSNLSSTVEYHGYADPGTATSAARWKVHRVTLNADGTAAAIDFMNGSNAFDQIWDNITASGVTYS